MDVGKVVLTWSNGNQTVLHFYAVRLTTIQYLPFARGMIYGMWVAGCGLQEIASEVEKPDGVHPSKQSVADSIAVASARAAASSVELSIHLDSKSSGSSHTLS